MTESCPELLHQRHCFCQASIFWVFFYNPVNSCSPAVDVLIVEYNTSVVSLPFV
ncbi:uncharacterized protein LACBIDRAFT_298544 [Laccaria bicolor S238N-H82]|uniref:Predicted protein n=1 Tax=Laccaria bicolor (strain S238N-H82 / ATCC MYA-4686) TaxID=486041 RepID=B0DD29_LACBS|nr:uncharacterized protein LACBIDRAFT_298544 [Laccaria bicolor S238N-H82]EDR07543.1 predicted protein [Laccaria bicolor S238N-H82]|eukprot:XP_001881935.1 predicted protein [Laccaria bicolor S238N-H82]